MADPLEIQNPTWTIERVISVGVVSFVLIIAWVFGGHRDLLGFALQSVFPLALIWFPDLLGYVVIRRSRLEPAAELTVTVLGWIYLFGWSVICLHHAFAR